MHRIILKVRSNLNESWLKELLDHLRLLHSWSQQLELITTLRYVDHTLKLAIVHMVTAAFSSMIGLIIKVATSLIKSLRRQRNVNINYSKKEERAETNQTKMHMRSSLMSKMEVLKLTLRDFQCVVLYVKTTSIAQSKLNAAITSVKNVLWATSEKAKTVSYAIKLHLAYSIQPRTWRRE